MYVLDKVHREICEMHIRRRNMEIRVIRAGYYWPTLRTDCTKYVKKCKECQEFSNTHYAPPKELHNITSPWPFTMWGMDILMPFPTTKSQIKFLLTELRKRLSKILKGLWVDELQSMLWRYHCTPQSTTQETPFRLTYGTEAMIPIEIEPALRF